MANNRKTRFNRRHIFKFFPTFSKRQKLIAGVLVLSLGLFISQNLLGKSGVYTVFSLAFLTDIILLLILYRDLKENFSPQLFILPFLFSLAFGLFYFLVPARFLTRLATTSLYALGLYSLFLSENIFIVSSIRTIALLTSARTVSFTITLLSYFFLSNVVLSLHFNIYIFIPFLLIYSFLLIIHSLWTHTLDKNVFANLYWVLGLTVCLIEIGILVWFWPSTPTVLALFLTGIFYATVGISQVWIEKRLFKGVLWEYMWIAVVVFVTLLLFTPWT
ncbi:MAG: hypothetical protein HYT08_04355 [Candidatus Levybacteria bacterium]|nr:hypothetical protein [Candidatus Levybacteria bacterium]